MIWIRYCLKCGVAFDMDTGQHLCPSCRRKRDAKKVGENLFFINEEEGK